MAKNAKIWIILGAVVLVAAIVIVLVIVFTQPKKTESYRTIQIYESEGTVTVDRENVGSLRAYANMRLQSGDVLTVGTDSHAYLKLDSDKYILAEAETVVEIIAEGTPEESKTTINLVKGAIVNRIDTALNENSSYEVNVSNSTMAIRGTWVWIGYPKNLSDRIDIAVMEGTVETVLKDGSGEKLPGSSRTFVAGKQIGIGTESKNGVYLEEKSTDLRELSKEALEFMDKSAEENGEKYGFDRAELQQIIQEKKEVRKIYTVTFMVGDTVFAVYRVEEGDKVVCPEIQPTENGSWKYQFDQPVEGDLCDVRLFRSL